MMRYDQGYGRHGGWEMRMEHGDHGYDRGYRDPGQGRGGPTERPWVGGYEPGYQGGSEGISVRTTGPLYNDTPGYARDFHERGYRRPRGAGPQGNRGGEPLRAGPRDRDPSFGRGEHGDTFAYGGPGGGNGFGASGGGMGRGSGYGRDFRSGYGQDYDRGMRGSGGYGRDFRNDAPWTGGRPRGF